MLDKYKDKYVKLLVSSDSGAGMGGEGRCFNSMIVIFGTITDFDKQFLELKNSTTMYYPGVSPAIKELFNTSINNVSQPQVFENTSSLVNLNNIIQISVVE